eukprot:m.223482 g.223482  ORF g.223482 m.223482 type:complete len:271 (-) comp16260_c0_seq1:241-1053(-)
MDFFTNSFADLLASAPVRIPGDEGTMPFSAEMNSSELDALFAINPPSSQQALDPLQQHQDLFLTDVDFNQFSFELDPSPRLQQEQQERQLELQQHSSPALPVNAPVDTPIDTPIDAVNAPVDTPIDGEDEDKDDEDDEGDAAVDQHGLPKTDRVELTGGRVVLVPITMYEMKMRDFERIFRAQFHASPEDVSLGRKSRRRFQLRKSSQKGRDEQRQRERELQSRLQTARTVNVQAILELIRDSVVRHVAPESQAVLLQEIAAGLTTMHNA